MEMEIKTKTALDMLTVKSVSVKTQKFYGDDALGLPSRKAYINSPKGRQAVIDELSAEDQNCIFAKWGDAATESDELPPREVTD